MISANQQKLFTACKVGDILAAKELLNKADVNVNKKTDVFGETPFYIAIDNNHEEMAKLLLEHGADIRQTNWTGHTALSIAILRPDDCILAKLLLGYGAMDARSYDFLDRFGGKELDVYTDSYAGDYLARLRNEMAQFHEENPEGIFDFPPDNADKSDTAVIGYYILRRLIKHCKVMDVMASIHLLLNIPSVSHFLKEGDFAETVLGTACEEGHETIVKLLLEKGAAVNQANSSGEPPLYWASKNGHGAVVDLLLAQDDIIVDSCSYDWLERHQQEYGNKVASFTKNYLANLSREIAQSNDDNLVGVFDFPLSDDGNIDVETVRMSYYVLRHLIRCCAVNEVNPLADEVDILEKIELLLNIPSVKTLVVANATSRELPANYNNDESRSLSYRLNCRQFAQQTNELLRLAQSTGDEAIAVRLLNISAIREAAEANHYYQGAYGIDLAEVAHDRESSMRALTPEEQESVKQIEKTYKKTIEENGGVSSVIKQLKQTLKKKYVADEASRILTFDDIDYLLPFKWNALQGFINRYDFTKVQQQAIYQCYYQNSYHTAYRYLSKPNRWMSQNAGWVSISEDREERWSSFEEYQPLIAYLWTAANDLAQGPKEADITVADRVDLFIRQIALINRAHNWDRYREVRNEYGSKLLDGAGEPIKESYDDLEGDKPSCFSGVKKRLFQSLLHHPLYEPLALSIVKQFVNETTREYYQKLLFGYDLKQLTELENGVAEYFRNFKESAFIDALALPKNYVREVKMALAECYGERRSEPFFPAVDELLNQKGLIANDFLRFYQSAGLGQLLAIFIETQLLRQILCHLVDSVAIDYLFQQVKSNTAAEFVKFNRLACDVLTHGVDSLWDAIEGDVKAQYLAHPDKNANEESWSTFVDSVKTVPLSLEAQEYVQGEMFRIVRTSAGYQAHHKRKNKNGIQASFWSVPVRQREKTWSLMDCVRAAATEHDRASKSNDERKAEVAESIKNWRQLDQAALAKEVYKLLKGHGSWNKNSFKAQVSWYVFNKLDSVGLKIKQADILNQWPIHGGQIRHHCNYVWSSSHREKAFELLLQAFVAEFPGADVVPVPKQRVKMI